MKPIVPRPITAEEAAVIRQALLRAALVPVAEEVMQSIATLRVMKECECGCRSIEFEKDAKGEYRIADGVGYIFDNERVDIIVWGHGKSIISLEIVDHLGAGQLPKANTVCSWEEAGKNAV